MSENLVSSKPGAILTNRRCPKCGGPVVFFYCGTEMMDEIKCNSQSCNWETFAQWSESRKQWIGQDGEPIWAEDNLAAPIQ